IKSKGAIVVWPTSDTAGTPPAEIKERFPDLVPEVPRAFERSVQGQLPLMRIGWAVIRPQGQAAPSAAAGGQKPSALVGVRWSRSDPPTFFPRKPLAEPSVQIPVLRPVDRFPRRDRRSRIAVGSRGARPRLDRQNGHRHGNNHREDKCELGWFACHV